VIPLKNVALWGEAMRREALRCGALRELT
jgi:hypothetical protein